jgi:hypothetical protein
MQIAPANRLMKTPLWRALLCGDRERITHAVKQINATGKTDEYALLLLTIRRRHARKYLIDFIPFTLPYSERERRSALTALGLLWGTLGRELAMALDPKASHFDRRHAHEALTRRRDRRAVRPLVDALLAGHALEAWQCIPTLGALGDLSAAEGMLHYIGIVGEIGAEQIPDLGMDVGRALRALNAKDAIETTKQALTSPNTNRRAIAALILSGWGDEALGDLLLPLLDDSEPLVCIAAITALGDLKVVSAMEAVKSRLNDPNAEVRLAAERTDQQLTTLFAQRTVRAARVKR